MNFLQEQVIDCPWCGEPVSVLVDCTVTEQSYVEDCAVCCQPMVLDIIIEQDIPRISVCREND